MSVRPQAWHPLEEKEKDCTEEQEQKEGITQPLPLLPMSLIPVSHVPPWWTFTWWSWTWLTKTKCFKWLLHAIFSESRGLKDFKYDILWWQRQRQKYGVPVYHKWLFPKKIPQKLSIQNLPPKFSANYIDQTLSLAGESWPICSFQCVSLAEVGNSFILHTLPFIFVLWDISFYVASLVITQNKNCFLVFLLYLWGE